MGRNSLQGVLIKMFSVVRSACWVLALIFSLYWNVSALPNEVDYTIQAQLDTSKNIIAAQE